MEKTPVETPAGSVPRLLIYKPSVSDYYYQGLPWEYSFNAHHDISTPDVALAEV